MSRGFGIIICVVAALCGGPAARAGDDEGTDTSRSGGEKLITLQAAKTEIVDALRLVAEQGGMNLVIGPEVTGQVSVYLENVPVETALRSIAVNNGFIYTVENGVITVSKPAAAAKDEKRLGPPMQTRIFTLQCQDAERIKEVLEFALTPSGKIKVLNENSASGYGSTKLSDLSGDLSSATGSTNNNYNSDNAVRNQMNRNTGVGGTTVGGGLNGTSSGGELPRNARILVVTDTAENLERIAELIADLDRMPPQVLIEARIVEMTTDLQRQLGIDWDVNILANGPVMNHTLPAEWRAGFAPGSQIRYAPDGTPRSSNGMALGTIDFSQFTSLVRVHASDNSIRLLANPRLLVFNNHSASILVGERYPLLQANITDQGTLTEALDTYVPVGIQLEVTPTIMSDGKVSMLVHPSTSSLGDEVVGTTGLRVRRILTREIDTRIVMQDARTIVLGGLISDRKIRTVSKIPGLGDLPGLDVLFRQESPESQRVDLLVFLTVHVEAATEISERDRTVYDMYRPQFKQIERSQDVPLHFEIPSEYEPPKARFGDPPPEVTDEAEQTEETIIRQAPKAEPPAGSAAAKTPACYGVKVPDQAAASSQRPVKIGHQKTLKTTAKDAAEDSRSPTNSKGSDETQPETKPLVQSNETP